MAPPIRPVGKHAAYWCPSCPKVFDVDKALHGHMRIHTRQASIEPASNEPAVGDKRKFVECSSSTGDDPSVKRKLMECSSSTCSSSSCSSSGSDSDTDSNEMEYSDEDVETENFHGRDKKVISIREKVDEFYHTWSTEDYYDGNGTDHLLRYLESLDLQEYDQSFISYMKGLIEAAIKQMDDTCTKTSTHPTPPMSGDDDCAGNSVGDDDSAGNSVSDGASESYESEAQETHEQKKVIELRENNTDLDGPYKCSMCEMRFFSHQALGGHQTKHRGERSLALSTTAEKEAIVKDHICKVCKKDFPTGQALGGHMRFHFTGILPHMKKNRGKEKLLNLGEFNVHENSKKSIVDDICIEVEPEEISGVDGVHSELEPGEIPDQDYDDGYEYEEGEIRPDVSDEFESLRIIPTSADCTKVVKIEQVKVKDEVRHKNFFNLNMTSRFEREDQNKSAIPTNQTLEDPLPVHEQEGEKQDAMVTSLTDDQEEPKSNPMLQCMHILPSPPGT